MKYIIYGLLLSILLLPMIMRAKKPYKAVIMQPIADAVGSPIHTLLPYYSPIKAYDSLPVCGGIPNSGYCCPRIHQLLFNEQVTVIQEQGDELMVNVSNCFYTTPIKKNPQHSYWILKKNIVSLQDLAKKGVAISNFPPPISFEDPASITDERVASLIKPWHDETTHQTFSAGTRFLKLTEQHNNDAVAVYIFNAQKKAFMVATIPAAFLVRNSAHSSQKKIELFIEILKQLAHPETGHIPYVWGGCSFTATSDQPFKETACGIKGKPCSFYEIKNFTATPKPGFDCSNMIMRAAQLAGIPFFFKNSYTIAMRLQPLHGTQKLSNGDIIWIAGHVLVVADTAKNTAIEARGYKSKGQGKIQEIELKKIFKGIDSFDALVRAWHEKQTLERLGDDGSIIEIIKDFKLLSLQSIM